MIGRDCDIAILGGGLAGGLIALALARLRPELCVLVIERDDRFGGNHVWSCFASDVEADHAWLIEPLIAARWDGYGVRFPGHSRELDTPYRSLTGEKLDVALRQVLPAAALLPGTKVIAATQSGITLDDGRELRAGGVIDARGFTGLEHFTGGLQKFLGVLVRLKRPHGLRRPVVMDAQVAQLDGYRFVYCLPFSETEIFIEDTYYSENPAIDAQAMRERIAAYGIANGWEPAEKLREEMGVLPVIGAGDFASFWPGPDSGPARAGARAGLVQPLTSYTLPDAVRFALHVAALPDVSGAALANASYEWARAHWRRGRFYRMLTRMLFGAGEPHLRFRLLERFYRLPEPLIERFYAGRSTRADMLRILAGRPPVPIAGALASIVQRGRPLLPPGNPA